MVLTISNIVPSEEREKSNMLFVEMLMWRVSATLSYVLADTGPSVSSKGYRFRKSGAVSSRLARHALF